MSHPEPEWITYTDILVIHETFLSDHGGESGIRDPGLLDSALTAPQNSFHYGETDLFVLAAGYAFALTLNHPFYDGNKRTAFGAAAIFLQINGYSFEATEVEAVKMMLSLTIKEISREQFAEWLRVNSKAK